MSTKKFRYVYRCTYVAALGGLLFGYDTAVISGAIGLMTEKYNLSPVETGWIASCALVGCTIGAIGAGPVSDRTGRKKVLLGSALAFVISSLGILFPWELTAFVLFRLIGGLGIGTASMIAPLYIAEISPAPIRGRLVSIYQLGVVCGILAVYFVNAGIVSLHSDDWNIHTGWRWMFGAGILPACLFWVMLLSVPESPRWLVARNRIPEARTILEQINGQQGAVDELSSIRLALSSQGQRFGFLLINPLRRKLLIGITLSVFSQVTGMNAILYYAPEIFKATGQAGHSAFIQTILIGTINLVFTLVAIRYVDQWGRRKLLLIGSAGMAICLAVIGDAFSTGTTNGYLILISILAYIGFFAVSLGPITFLLIAELFPTSVRGYAMSICIFFLWASVYLVSQTFPVLRTTIGNAGTFWLYMFMSIGCFVFVWKLIPETKGQRLEEINNGTN